MKKNLIYTPSCIANYFIENIEDVSNLKLNKLIYLAFGIAYGYYNRLLVKEPIQAWRLGPVIPSIYHEFKRYGYGKIKKLSYIDNPLTDERSYPMIEEDDKEAIDSLETVKKEYGYMSASELIDYTHEIGGPWYSVYQDGDFNIEITPKMIKEYFKKEVIVW